jgi:NADPH2:quinone reductase
MRAIVVETHGGPEVLQLTERPDPAPDAGQVLVDVTAAGINYIDVYLRTGLYPSTPPYVPGVEGAGVVAAVGAGVDSIAVGDRVAWAAGPGSYAERVAINASVVVPVPDGVPDDVAGGALLQGMTAHYLTHDTYRVQPGDDVLIHAAAGGMGLLLTQIVTQLGARAIGTVSSAEKEKLAREAGAAEVIRYDETDFATEVRRLTGAAGVQVAYDGVGQATFDGSLASLRRRGLLALYGQASGPVPPFEVQRLQHSGSVFLTRPTLAHYIAEREELVRRAGDVFRWVADGSLTIRIGGRYPLADAAAAHTDLEARRTTGKLLLLPR